MTGRARTRRPVPLGLLGAGFVLGLAVSGAAQPVADPRIVEFAPSSDHSVPLPDGRPAVTAYIFEVYQAGASAPFHTVNMGKPAPQADGFIRYDFSGGVGSWPLPGGVYESRVAAVGPHGTGRSPLSNQFTLGTAAVCAYAVSPSTVSLASVGGVVTIGVTAQAGCAWQASASAAWVTAAPTSGAGSGKVTLTVARNSLATARSATVKIGGQNVSVGQARSTAPSAPRNPRIVQVSPQ